MKSLLLAATLMFVASAKLQATEALIFEGGGYNICILIGMAEHPVVAQVRFTAPGANEFVQLPHEQLQIKKFDMDERALDMRFSNQKNDPELPASFSLSVKKNKALLSINGKKIRSSFDWLDE
ncbi:MAG: hypothetical protein ACJ8NS_06910 [Chthoniobacterales bacterium]